MKVGPIAEPSPQCAVYLWDKGRVKVPERFTPKDWPSHHYSHDHHLYHALQHHPWRVYEEKTADLLLVAANLSKFCSINKFGMIHQVWRDIKLQLGPTTSSPAAATSRSVQCAECAKSRVTALPGQCSKCAVQQVPAAVVLTNRECGLPWDRDKKALADRYIFIYDHEGIVAPSVLPEARVTKWRTLAKKQHPMKWMSRPLLFFAMHVPKLYLSVTRYEIWRQIRSIPGVLALSSTINCTIGQFAICPQAAKQNFNISKEVLSSYCYDACAYKTAKDSKADLSGEKRVPRNEYECLGSASRLRRICDRYGEVRWDEELADMDRATTQLTETQYATEMMRHRFCIMAPGDFISSPKITEFTVAGGVGGCLPLIVVAVDEAANMLPYARWLDWCSIAYIVEDRTAEEHMDRVLAQLANVSASAAREKRRAIAAVLGAFVFKEPAQVPQSTGCADSLDRCTPAANTSGAADPARHFWGAADFILAEACAAAQRMRQGLSADPTDAWPSSAKSLQRCMIR